MKLVFGVANAYHLQNKEKVLGNGVYMAKNVTMRDIASKLGISAVTVSKALTDKEGVGVELREKIKSTADDMGYAYTGTFAAAKKGDRNLTIGVIVEEHYVDNNTTSFPFYMKMYNFINKHMSKYHYSVILETITAAMLNSNRMPNIVTEKKVDGIIVLGQVRSMYLNKLKNKRLPMVYLDFYDRNMEVPSVINDNVYGTYMLTNHLIEKGHKKIAYVGSIDATASILDRYLGYYRSLVTHQISLNDSYILPDRDERGYLITIDFPEDMPTAFVCNCDGTAVQVMRQLRGLGYKIPEDISVVGFDNYSAEVDYSLPKLTTIEVNIEELTKNAVELIIRLINGERSLGGRKVISGKLILRDSVAQAK